jgi:hypothetical protein
MSFFNQYSFLWMLAGLGALLALGLWRWRKGNPYVRAGLLAWYVFGALVLTLTLRYPTSTITPQSPEQVEALISNQQPSFVVLYSRY